MINDRLKVKDLIAQAQAWRATPEGRLARINSNLHEVFELYDCIDLTPEQYEKFGRALMHQFEILTEIYGDQ